MKNIINNIFSPNLSSKSETDKLFADWKQWDFEYLLEHFDVKNIATERGLANIPASSATTQDEFHANLESRYRIIIADRTADINNRIESLESRSERAHEKIDFLNDEKVNLQDKLEQDYEAYKPEITLLNSRVKSAKDELNKFKKQNKLTRDADYPETLWWHYFVLISLVVIESVINASFFAEPNTILDFKIKREGKELIVPLSVIRRPRKSLETNPKEIKVPDSNATVSPLAPVLNQKENNSSNKF